MFLSPSILSTMSKKNFRDILNPIPAKLWNYSSKFMAYRVIRQYIRQYIRVYLWEIQTNGQFSRPEYQNLLDPY